MIKKFQVHPCERAGRTVRMTVRSLMFLQSTASAGAPMTNVSVQSNISSHEKMKMIAIDLHNNETSVILGRCVI